MKRVLLTDDNLKRIFHQADDDKEIILGLYGHVLRLAEMNPKGVSKLPEFTCGSDTWELISNMIIIQNAGGTLNHVTQSTAREIGDHQLIWYTHGFKSNDDVPPMMVEFDEEKVKYKDKDND